MMSTDTSRAASYAASHSKRRPGKSKVDAKTQAIRLKGFMSSGMTIDQAAEEIGIQPITAKRYIQRFNRTTPEAIQARKEEAAKKELEALKKYLDDGYSVYQAAKLMRADPGRIYGLVKEKSLKVSWVRPNGRQGRISQLAASVNPMPDAVTRVSGRSKFPRNNFCIGAECQRVYRQEHEGHRMCKACRNKSW